MDETVSGTKTSFLIRLGYITSMKLQRNFSPAICARVDGKKPLSLGDTLILSAFERNDERDPSWCVSGVDL